MPGLPRRSVSLPAHSDGLAFIPFGRNAVQCAQDEIAKIAFSAKAPNGLPTYLPLITGTFCLSSQYLRSGGIVYRAIAER